MKLVICIDERGGMAFGGRRVSRDRLLISDLSELISDSTLFIEPYSAELFEDSNLNIIVSDKPMRSAEAGDFAFIELFDPAPYLNLAEELIIYKWNRRYPFDLSMSKTPSELGFKLKSVFEFKGRAHDKITREIYTK